MIESETFDYFDEDYTPTELLKFPMYPAYIVSDQPPFHITTMVGNNTIHFVPLDPIRTITIHD